MTCDAPLVQAIDAALPQTQCTRCGYPDCLSYARAIASGQASINQCPPGGAEGVARLAAITGQPLLALNPDNGAEAPRALAVIDENWCIGCTLCIKACPVDAIVGANKTMHTIVEEACTGCELCVPVCPVDCIAMENVSGQATGWSAWSTAQAELARASYQRHLQRRQQRQPTANADGVADAPTDVLTDALADMPTQGIAQTHAASPPTRTSTQTPTQTPTQTQTPPARADAANGDAKAALLAAVLEKARARRAR